MTYCSKLFIVWDEILHIWYLDIVWVEFYVVVISGIVHFTAIIMPNFFFALTGITVFMDFYMFLF
jgi:hypothetical protein